MDLSRDKRCKFGINKLHFHKFTAFSKFKEFHQLSFIHFSTLDGISHFFVTFNTNETIEVVSGKLSSMQMLL